MPHSVQAIPPSAGPAPMDWRRETAEESGPQLQDEKLLEKVCNLLEAAGLAPVLVVPEVARPTLPATRRPHMARRAAYAPHGPTGPEPSGARPGTALRRHSSPNLVLLRTGSEPVQEQHVGEPSAGEAKAAPIIIVTTSGSESATRAALAAGGLAYAFGGGEEAANPRAAVHPAWAAIRESLPVESSAARTGAHDRGLTSREVQVLKAFANGALTVQVARQLFVSPKTVKNHLAHIYAKLGVATRTQAVSRAVKLGIVTID